MGKGRFFGSLALLIATVAVGSWGGGCGKANDQGISFRALGFFAADDGSVTDSGANVSLTNDSQVPVDRDCDQWTESAHGFRWESGY